MRFPIFAGAAALFVGFGSTSFAQSKDPATFTHGESKRCESLSGDAKALCDKEEATKTQGAAAEEATRPPSGRESEGARAAERPASAGSTSSESGRAPSQRPTERE